MANVAPFEGALLMPRPMGVVVYFIDAELGLCYFRIATYAPFGVQFYCNGHNILANKLDNAKVKYHMSDNCFDYIGDYNKAQTLADNFNTDRFKELLEYYAKLYCPVHSLFSGHLNWSMMQIEYSTDIIFKDKETLSAIYSDITKTAILTVRVNNMATFLGKRFTKAFSEEAGSKYKVMREGTCVKHFYGKQSIKIYDKAENVLRIETTSNNVSKFFIYRPVRHRDGTVETKYASTPKDICYLNAVNKIMLMANNRYIEFMSAFEEHSIERKKLDKVTERVVENNRSYRGINFFYKDDELLLKTIILGEFNIDGFRNKDIRKKLKDKNPAQISRIIKNLRLHGVLKKVTNKYKYYVTENGKDIILSVFRMKELYLIPSLT